MNIIFWLLGFLILGLLCAKNAKTAMSRGRKPFLFIVLTILLMFVGYYVGVLLGILIVWLGDFQDKELAAQLIGIPALPFSIIGLIVASYIASHCKEGDINIKN